MKNSLYKTIITLWLGHFLIDMMLGVWPVYKTMAQLDLAKAGLIAGVGALIGEGCQLIFGSLSDQGYRRLLIIFGIFASSSNIFLPYTESYIILFVFYVLTCLGSGAFHPSAAGLAGSLTLERKGLFIGIFASGGALGMAFSQFIFTQSYYFFEGRMIFMGIPSFLLVAYLCLSQTSSDNSTFKRKKKQLFESLTLFRIPFMRTLYFSQVANQTLLWGTIFLLPDLLHSRGYDTWLAFGGGHFAFIIGSALMMAPAGWLADKFSAKEVIIGATIIGGIAFYTLLSIPTLSSSSVLLLLFIYGAMIGVVNPVSISYGNRLMPGKSGMVSAFLMGLVWCVSEFIGPGGGGLMASFFQDDGPTKALSVIGIFSFFTLFFAMRLPKTAPSFELQQEEA